MVPIRLCLNNFLSYRHVTLDFTGLHVACICGANGAGKSSLLEAIPWAIWGKSRVTSEDDVIHLGEMEAEVRFHFRLQDQTYRVIRRRHRQQGSGLEFQVQTQFGFRSLTAKSIRATQQVIQRHVKLDYDTFLNSAYLKQGHGDEFMAKRPSDRKQLLADILNLEQYDRLADAAKERSHQIKAELSLLTKTLERMQQQLSAAVALTNQQAEVATAIAQLRTEQESDRIHLTELQGQLQQYHQQHHQIELHQQQQHHLTQDCERLQNEWQQCHQAMEHTTEILAEAEAIAADYAQWQVLQTEAEQLTAQLQIQQSLHQRHQTIQQQYNTQKAAIQQQLHQAQTQRDTIDQQLQTLQGILQQSDRITHAHRQLQQARQQCDQLDQLQLQVHPLSHQQRQLQLELNHHQIRLQTRLKELQTHQTTLRQQLEKDQAQHDQGQQEAIAIAQQLKHLQQRRAYQEKVRDKGIERRHFLERLHERQRDLEAKLATLTTALNHLDPNHEATCPQTATVSTTGVQQPLSLSLSSLPALLPALSCPLCTCPLDTAHWQIVQHQYQTQQDTILRDLWVLREQMTVSEREIHVLREEYKAVEAELSQYGLLLHQQGRLEAELRQQGQGQRQIQELTDEIENLKRQLADQDYGHEQRSQLTTITQQIQALGYDDKNHALARGSVQQWRWAEAKGAELRQAQKRQTQLSQERERVKTAIAHQQQRLHDLAQSPLHQQLQTIEQQQATLNYNAAHHDQVREQIRQGQDKVWRYQQLETAKQRHPQLQQQLAELKQTWGDRQHLLASVTQTLVQLTQEQAGEQNQREACTQAIQTTEQQIQGRRSQLDALIIRQGELQQQQRQLATLKQDYEQSQAQAQQLRHQLRIHQELQKSFGKNGIQAFMIENLLPQFEAEANRILAQLSGNQLHLQFVTQRASKSKRSRGIPDGWIDTLDILVADLQGTRSYETYSGGEAFRVSFALRLALARLLAQRSGTALQLLIIDEGFGSQDQAGCDRLITAINAIAPEFACILTITHMPHLKAVFDTRVEVTKTSEGSQINLIGVI
ncbi:MAG: AAA family ATPase [Cyanothece sp. SIO2G6]|nr:AAA family ATPase [Cyanothece sp. SIO2G6]